MDATIKLEHDLVALERENDVHAMLELAVPDVPRKNGRPPLALALVIDRSGSMAGTKLAVARHCAEWLAGRLRAGDRIALVEYDTNARLSVPLGSPASPVLKAGLASLRPGSSTNLSGGWLKGLEQLRGQQGTKKIMLLTDGLANVGITDRPTLVRLVAGAAGDGVGTSTIGFGADFDEDLLTAMSEAAGGNTHFAETPDVAPAIFAEEFDELARLVAQNVSAEIRPSAAVEVVGLLNGYPHVGVDGGVQISIGDAYAGERRRIVFALNIPALTERGVEKVADVILRYVSVGDRVEQHEVTIPIVVNRVSADEAAGRVPDLEVREEVVLLAAAQARDRAIELADAGRLEDARSLLDQNVNGLRQMGFDGEASALAADLGRLDSYDLMLRKKLRYDSIRRRRGKQV
jgi:Ca-activated chloride channel family protein